MPRYRIVLGMTANRWRKLPRLVECKDLATAEQVAIRRLEYARTTLPAGTAYDTWTIYAVEPGTLTTSLVASGKAQQS